MISCIWWVDKYSCCSASAGLHGPQQVLAWAYDKLISCLCVCGKKNRLDPTATKYTAWGSENAAQSELQKKVTTKYKPQHKQRKRNKTFGIMRIQRNGRMIYCQIGKICPISSFKVCHYFPALRKKNSKILQSFFIYQHSVQACYFMFQ